MSAPAARKPLHLRVASAIVPDAGKRTIDRARTRMYRRRIAPLREEYVRRYGLEVLRGPFAGLRYTPGLPAHDHVSHHLIAKLVGNYEKQIYPWIEEWIASELDLVIDVGCAEGFYAVGLARAMPAVQVRAYDIYAQAREDCAELARANSVEDRVQIGGECTPATLAAISERRVALLSDCEGYEKVLLDPELAPNLRNWSIIVEQHILQDATIAATIAQRFCDTHAIEVIDYIPPDGAGLTELEWLSEEQVRFVLSERPFPMSWAMLRPLGGAA
jgi:precorrin-6B methylase 2